jgi:hypothetical protein
MPPVEPKSGIGEASGTRIALFSHIGEMTRG